MNSKTQLKNLMNCEPPIPKVVLYCDRWNVCGRSLVWSNLKTHLNNGRRIDYVCYSIDPQVCSESLNAENSTSATFHDLYSDPLGWKDSGCLLASMSLQQVVDEKNAEVIVVDKVDCATKYFSETFLLKTIHKWKQAEHIFQIILFCGEDVCSPSFLLALNHLSSAVVSLKPTSPLTSSVLIKRKNGKIIKTEEEFTLNSELAIENSHAKKDKIVSPSASSLNELDLSFKSTFSLTLTEDQKATKQRLILPHTRIQSTGGQIHYVPDEGDDWDDEDPDDDLEI